MKPPIFKIYQARDLTQKEEGLLRRIVTYAESVSYRNDKPPILLVSTAGCEREEIK